LERSFTFGKRRRNLATRGIIVLVSVLLSTTIATISNLLSKDYYLYSLVALVAGITILGLYLLLFDRIEGYFWKISYQKKFSDPIIGILKDERCPPMFTRFAPEDWRNRFHGKYKTKIISHREICNDLAVLINPYGETYPEEDLMKFTTLQRIENYVVNGGIFVHAGGLAFFYGWDGRRNFPTGKGVQLISGNNDGADNHGNPASLCSAFSLVSYRNSVETTIPRCNHNGNPNISASFSK